LISQSVEFRRFINLEDIATIVPGNIEHLNDKTTLLYYSKPIFDSLKFEESPLMEIAGHKNYEAILKEVIIIGESNLILLNKQNALYYFKQYDFQNRFRYTDTAIQYYKNDCCLIKINESKISFKEAIFLGGNFSWNYYHFLYEILVKFERIDALNLDLDIPILVDKKCFHVPQYFELISFLNKKNRKIILLNKGERYLVNRMHYFLSPNFIPPNYVNDNEILPEDVLLNLKSLNYLKINLLPLSTKTDFPKRIYISRSKASSRRQFNENEVFDILEKFGFITVFPENYSIADQITMFYNAEFITGGSGAAFTNLLFCKPLCKVIIFAKNSLPFSGFSTIASYAGVNMTYITENLNYKDITNDIHASFNINTEKLNDILKKWIA
jgi:capsular polysaccharide biosynthesis protein